MYMKYYHSSGFTNCTVTALKKEIILVKVKIGLLATLVDL